MSAPRRYALDADWHDWAAVHRAVHGAPVGRALTYCELLDAHQQMRGRGMELQDIAAHVGLTLRELRLFLDSDASSRRRRARTARKHAQAVTV